MNEEKKFYKIVFIYLINRYWELYVLDSVLCVIVKIRYNFCLDGV